MRTIMKQVCVLGLLACVLYVPARAQPCAITVQTGDQMTFDPADIHLAAKCTQLALTLVHKGSLSADVMGHNWVLTRPDDSADVAQAGMQAGRENDYVHQHDARVIAHTRLIGGGETTRIEFSTRGLKPGQPYAYFCSFPGHASLMRGILTVN